MAEDVEVMSVNEEAEEDGEDGVNRRVLSTSSDITSSNSAIQPAQNAASNGKNENFKSLLTYPQTDRL